MKPRENEMQTIKVKKDIQGKCWKVFNTDEFFGPEDDPVSWIPLPFTLKAPFSMVRDRLRENNPECEIIEA